MITLVLGGTRSGKSAVAERIAAAQPEPHLYVACGEVTDEAMAARIAAHRARRPPSWTTLEAGSDLPAVLRNHPGGTALVDSLGSWLVAAQRQPGIEARAEELLNALRARSGATVLVTEEVGWCVHPSTEAGRMFTDRLGTLNQAVSMVADEVLLVVAGRSLSLPPVQE